MLLAVILLMIYIFAEKREVTRFDWRLFGATLLRLDWRWLGLACVFCLLTYYGRALRWAVLIRPVKADASIRRLTSATVVGFTALVLLGRPAELVRPYLIAMKEHVPVSSQLGAWLLERLFDLLVALLIFGVALSQVRTSGVKLGIGLSWVLAAGGWFAGIIGALSLAILLLIRHFSETMRRRLLDGLGFLRERHYERAEKLVNAFVQGVESTRSDRSMVLLIAYTLLEWLLIAACYYCLVCAYGQALPFGILDTLILMGFVSFGSAIQIPGIGGGVQVMTVLVLNELFAVPLEVATSAALLIWIVTVVVVVPFGIALAVHDGLSLARLRSIEKEAGL